MLWVLCQILHQGAYFFELSGYIDAASLIWVFAWLNNPHRIDLVEMFLLQVVVGEAGELGVREACLYVESYGHGGKWIHADWFVVLFHICVEEGLITDMLVVLHMVIYPYCAHFLLQQRVKTYSCLASIILPFFSVHIQTSIKSGVVFLLEL